MNFDKFVNTKNPRECCTCPNCEAINWVLGPHPYLIEHIGDEVVECWKCSTHFWANEYFEELYGGRYDDAMISKGVPDPVIPITVLETLVDLAQAQRDALIRDLQEDEADNSLLNYIDHIEDCANYVKELLKEGKLPEAEILDDCPF